MTLSNKLAVADIENIEHENDANAKRVVALGKTTGSLYIPILVNSDGTIVGAGTGGTGTTNHAALTNLNWGSAGHTIDVTFNVGANNLIVDSGVLWVNSTTNQVGIGTTDSGYTLDVRGNVCAGAGVDGSGLKLRMLDGTTVQRCFDPTNVGATNSINFGCVGSGGELRAHGGAFRILAAAGNPEFAKFDTAGIHIETQREARFYDTGNTNYISLKSPSSVSASVSFILPSTDGSTGQFLRTNGTGSFGWSSGESPLTFSSPLTRSTNTISFLYNTVNTWTNTNSWQKTGTSAFTFADDTGANTVVTIDTTNKQVIVGGANSWIGVTGDTDVIVLGSASATINGTLSLLANNIATDTVTGMKIGTASTQKLGFFNTTPIAQPSAYTQTYTSSSKTQNNLTASSVSTDSSSQVTPFGYTSSAQADGIPVQINNLITDVANIKQVLNQVIDDLQGLGLLS